MKYKYKNSLKSNASDEFVNVYVQRPIAGVFTFLFFYTPITPNFVTLLSTISGIWGGILLFFPAPNFLFAAILFYLKDILDSADGQLARAKQLYSRRGRFYDSIGDFVVHVFLFTGIFVQLRFEEMNLLFAFFISLIGFLGVNLRVSYNVYYQTAFLHQLELYRNNRLSEEIQDEDLPDKFTLHLQKIFLLMYGWQDILIKKLDEMFLKNYRGEIKNWYKNPAALFLNRFFGLGTEFVGLTICLLCFGVKEYLFFSIVAMNAVWYIAMLWRMVKNN